MSKRGGSNTGNVGNRAKGDDPAAEAAKRLGMTKDEAVKRLKAEHARRQADEAQKEAGS